MAIITLTSDWGINNHYIGSVKGSILRQIPEARIVDITHSIKPFDIMCGSFVLKYAFPDFPAGTIHVIGLNTEASPETPHIALKFNDMFFIGADNGIFSLLIDHNPFEAVELNIMQDSDYFTFSTRDVFVKAAAIIAKSNNLLGLGTPYTKLNKLIPLAPVVHKDRIDGKVIFIDGYDNVIVNIDRDLFKKVVNGRPFAIKFRSKGYTINTLKTSYSDVIPGERVALFGSTGLLEIAINRGKAASLLGLELTDNVSVFFGNTE